MLLTDGHLWMVPQLRLKICHTHTVVADFNSTPITHHTLYAHTKNLALHGRLKVYFTLNSSQWDAEWRAQTAGLFHPQRCAAGGLLHIYLSAPLWANSSAVHQEVRSRKSYRGRDQSRGVAPCYVSITAQVSHIYHCVQAAWGRSSVPNITNQGINPVNNLLMQLRHATEHSNADCV